MSEAEPGLEDDDVDEIDEVADVVSDEPVAPVALRLVGEDGPQRDDGAVVHVGQHHHEQPRHVQLTWTQVNLKTACLNT